MRHGEVQSCYFMRFRRTSTPRRASRKVPSTVRCRNLGSPSEGGAGLPSSCRRFCDAVRTLNNVILFRAFLGQKCYSYRSAENARWSGMLVCALQVGRGLGPFVLGAPIADVIRLICTHKDDYPRVEVTVCEPAKVRIENSCCSTSSVKQPMPSSFSSTHTLSSHACFPE
jgi:hypothetical protein